MRNDATTCVSELIASKKGLESLQGALSTKLDPTFMNGPVTNVLEYLQHPGLKDISGGTVLAQVSDVLWHLYQG